jgi:hypothetical protein
MITGHGGYEPPTSITIWLRLGRKSPRLGTWSSAGVEVETMSVPYPQPPELFEHANIIDVISYAIAPPDLTFPLTLRVERSKPKIPVDGRDRIFTTYLRQRARCNSPRRRASSPPQVPGCGVPARIRDPKPFASGVGAAS